MSKDVHIADVVVHLHPQSSCDDWTMIEKDLRSQNGVVSVHFDTKDHPHAAVVAYNPDAVSSEEVLATIRKCDSQAVMAGL